VLVFSLHTLLSMHGHRNLKFSFLFDMWPSKMKRLSYLETSGANHPVTLRHIPRTTSSKTLNAIVVQNVDFLQVKVECAYRHHSVSFELRHFSYVIRTCLLHTYQTQYCHNASDILSVQQAVCIQQRHSHRGIFNQKWYWRGLLQICLYRPDLSTIALH
jgi:hypothetical protein